MINFIRSLCFYIIFYFGTTCYFLLFSPVRFFSDKLVISLSSFWTTCVIGLAKLILGINFEVEGKNNIPSSGSFLVASNHQAAWETFFFGSFFPGSIFILKEELKKIPIFSQYFKKLGFIFVKRNEALSSLRIVLNSIRGLMNGNKKIFVIFPEGTRLKPGDRVKLNAGVFAIHKFIGLPILPVRLNSGEFWHNKKFIKTSGTIKIKIFPLIRNELNKENFIKKLEKSFYK